MQLGVDMRNNERNVSTFIHSRFRCIKIFRNDIEDPSFNCNVFTSVDELCIGGSEGAVKFINVWKPPEKEIEEVKIFDTSAVERLTVPKASYLMSASYSPPLLASSSDSFCLMREKLPVLKVANFTSAEFGAACDKIIARSVMGDSVSIYNIVSGALETSFSISQEVFNTYSSPKFNSTDDLILCDSCLFDPRSGMEVKRFDTLSSNRGDQVFLPCSNRILLDGAMWDLRNYRLLQVVPELEGIQHYVFPCIDC
jgi:hypothetical protein